MKIIYKNKDNSVGVAQTITSFTFNVPIITGGNGDPKYVMVKILR